jgi:hypothetical protein
MPESKKRMPWVLPMERFFRRHPALRIAFNIARRRFRDYPGVRGIGLGRRYIESEKRYHEGTSPFDGFCIKVLVARKIDIESLPPAMLIPRSIKVTPPGLRKQVEVFIDIVTAGNPRLQFSNGAIFSAYYEHSWPTGDRNYFEPGRIFTYSINPVNREHSSFSPDDERRLGTIGAVIVGEDARHYAISSAHVFLDYCEGHYEAPSRRHGVGVRYRDWIRLGYGAETPYRIIDNYKRIFDVMALRLPKSSHLIKEVGIGWPPNFQGKLADSDDYEVAIRSNYSNAFLWIERNGRSIRLPCDLDSGINYLITNSCGSSYPDISYPFAWPTRFLSDVRPVQGDSGAGLYVPAASGNEVRLLGFHFMYDYKTCMGYSMSARSFFRRLKWERNGERFRFSGYSNLIS